MQPNSVELKRTVNLPRTDFPMKANLPQNEPKILARWDEERLYHRIRVVPRAGLAAINRGGSPGWKPSTLRGW